MWKKFKLATCSTFMVHAFVFTVIRCGGSRSKKRKMMYTAKKNAGTMLFVVCASAKAKCNAVHITVMRLRGFSKCIHVY